MIKFWFFSTIEAIPTILYLQEDKKKQERKDKWIKRKSAKKEEAMKQERMEGKEK